MNKKRRAQICTIINAISEVQGDLGDVYTEEESCRDNIPENLQNTDKYDDMCDIVDVLENAVNSLSEAIDYLENVI